MNKENLNKLQMAYKIMNSTENNKEYSYKELSNLVGIDTNQTKMIYTLYSLQTTKLKITPINFVDFILQHKEDSELKGSIKADTVSNLKLIDKVMESVINNKKYSANEISNLLLYFYTFSIYLFIDFDTKLFTCICFLLLPPLISLIYLYVL